MPVVASKTRRTNSLTWSVKVESTERKSVATVRITSAI